MTSRRHRGVTAWVLSCALSAGCPASVLQQDQLAFTCQHDYQCSQGYRCVDRRCQAMASLLDGGATTVDASAREGPRSETGAGDGPAADRAPADLAAADLAALDRPGDAGTLDATGHDLVASDALTADGPGQDQAVADGAPDATVPADSASSVDTAQPDSPLEDSARLDVAQTDLASLDRAAPDTAQADTASEDLAQPDMAAPDTAQPDTASDVDATPPCPGAAPGGAFCASGDPLLAACYTFDTDVANGDGTWRVVDGSGNGNHGTGSGHGYGAGHVGQALALAGTGSVVVADSASLDVTPAMTLEAWVWLAAYPASGRMAILDNNGQYGFFVYAGTPPNLRCSAGSVAINAPAPELERWVHVACVNDDAAAERRLLIDGAVVATGPGSAPPTADTTPFDIGANSPDHNDNWNGFIDQLRVWNGVRTDAELCWEARQ